jgi:hypothetical protein
VELKKWLRANISIMVANDKRNNRITSEAGLIRENTNSNNVTLSEKPMINSITS